MIVLKNNFELHVAIFILVPEFRFKFIFHRLCMNISINIHYIFRFKSENLSSYNCFYIGGFIVTVPSIVLIQYYNAFHTTTQFAILNDINYIYMI